MAKSLTAGFFQHQPLPRPANRWVVGFSGGLDSSVLLKLCVDYRNQYRPDLELLGVHVNHGLSDQADQWQIHCESVCESWQVSLVCQQAIIVPENRKSTEQLARAERYRCFREELKPDDLLLLAHHLDDQAETLLYRLMRGSGVLGLGGMQTFAESPADADSTGSLAIWRPLLSLARSELEEFAHGQHLTWIEDPSNQDTGYDRNFIRHQVMPLLSERWPAARQTLGRSARLAAESAELNDFLAAQDLDQILDSELPHRLAIPPLQRLSEVRLKNCLRFWLRQRGATLPSEQRLVQVVAAIQDYHTEKHALIDWGEAPRRWEIRTFDHGLWLVRPGSVPGPEWSAVLTADSPLELPAGLGRIRLCSGKGSAEAADLLNPANLNEPLKVRFRQGGERFRPARRPAKSLKKWLQEWQIPPWERERLPLAFCGDELVWIPGYGVAEGYGFQDGLPEEGAPALAIFWDNP